MEKGTPHFDYETCVACGVCAQVCPVDCVELSKIGISMYKSAYPQLTDADICTACKMCENQCPVDAVMVKVLV